MDQVTLVGPLAHADMRDALGVRGGQAQTLAGRLIGGRWAGVRAGGWPRLAGGDGQVAAWRADLTPAIHRYAEVMGLSATDIGGETVLGLQAADDGQGDEPFDIEGWHPDLAAEIARHILEPGRAEPRILAARLPMIAAWCASRLRGRAMPAPAQAPGYRQIAMHEPYAHFFSVEALDFSADRHDGQGALDLHRAVFISSDAAIVLPWDPVRDRVLLVEQFRAGPAARTDPDAFLLEAIAGRIDAGETPEAAIAREAVEEAGITLTRLIPGPGFYPSPGMIGEYIYSFVGLADLPDGTARLAGLPEEGEDIRGVLMDRRDLTRLAVSGGIANGPLLIAALWLDRQAATLAQSV